MNTLSLKKSQLKKFLSKVMQSHELIAPLKSDLVRFTKIEEPKQAGEIYLKENAFFPLKEYFFRKQEQIFAFDGNKITVNIEKPQKRVFFGVRKCDLNAIKHQDMVFLEKNVDPYYKAQRDEAVLIGYHCNEAPSIYCFCGSMNLQDYYDLMFYDRGKEFIIDIGTEKGSKFLSGFKDMVKTSEYKITENDKKIEGTDRLFKKDISGLYDNPGWQKGVDMCVSCGACTTLCPTCYCFETKDKKDIHDTSKSERIREWSSCQVKEFTTVASGHTFREKREERFKHRIFHQLEYFKEKNGIDLCVGCGRCITGCPTRIDFVDIINKM